jgi:hypothetical protein
MMGQRKNRGTLVQSELMLLTKDIGDDGYALACTPQCNLANMKAAES